jgi:hypothetical protein
MDLLTSPDLLAEAMDDSCGDTSMENLRSQIELLDQQTEGREHEDVKLYKAYVKGPFDEEEYADRGRELRLAMQSLQEEESLASQTMSQEEFRKRGQLVSDWVEEMRAQLQSLDVPFGIRRRIAKMVVD